ncbi:MAG: CRISPR-associated helicase Cas3' [Myxococcales bacterium]|nr:CRISPR-associated helicase Cas3' [Myxococcales bacterium]
MTHRNYEEMFQAATANRPFPYQVAFATGASLPALVRAPTGAGKTATAVLGWLWRRRFHADEAVRTETPRRLVFCLPMRTLVEQTAQVAGSWLERLGLRDQVGLHMLMGGAVDEAWEAHPERDTILIGTQDQLLSRALNRGYGMSRYRWPVHFALLNNDALWILDEVQLMGPGLSTSAQLDAFRAALGTQRPCRSVWMSATLSTRRLRTVDLGARDLPALELTAADLDHSVLARRHHARKVLAPAQAEGGDVRAVAAEIVAVHGDGLTLAVVNRVARARDLYAAVRERAGDVAVRLIHSRFRPDDRARIQAEALADGWSGILIATQAIEAGVDLSARVLFTELASWSSLVQRFGRCNRRGEHAEALVRWIDVADEDAAPYEPSDLQRARARLAELSECGPAALAAIGTDEQEPALPVIRRRDLLQLFDTEPDLVGHDLDISRYVREASQRDVQVAWRSFDREPEAESPEPHRRELCTVPVYELEKLLKAHTGWRWAGAAGRWERVRDPVPGMVVLLPVTAGGYSPELGWTGSGRHIPPPVDVAAGLPDADDREALSFACSTFVTLADHAQDVFEEASALQAALGTDAPWPEILRSARWHDLGKAHPVFQEMIISGLADDDPRRAVGPWAKSDGRPGARSARPGFRHELVSALVLLREGGSDLEAYLVAAHHGKVRTTIRSRPGEREPVPPLGPRFALGVWDHDQVPLVDLQGVASQPAELDLEIMELGRGAAGPSWTERTARLLAEHGPFRLAFWETLVRVADWRGTARRRTGGVEEAQ